MEKNKNIDWVFIEEDMMDISNCLLEHHKDIDIDFIIRNEDRDITSDTRAVLSSIYRYKNIDEKELVRLIKCSGKLENDEIETKLWVFK